MKDIGTIERELQELIEVLRGLVEKDTVYDPSAGPITVHALSPDTIRAIYSLNGAEQALAWVLGKEPMRPADFIRFLTTTGPSIP